MKQHILFTSIGLSLLACSLPASAQKSGVTSINAMVTCSNTEEGSAGSATVDGKEIGELTKTISLSEDKKELRYRVQLAKVDFDKDGQPDKLSYTLVTRAHGGLIDIGGKRTPSVGILGGASEYVDTAGEGFEFKVEDVELELSSGKRSGAMAKGFSRYSLYRMSDDAKVRAGEKLGGNELNPPPKRAVGAFKPKPSLFIFHEAGEFRLGRVCVTLRVEVAQ